MMSTLIAAVVAAAGHTPAPTEQASLGDVHFKFDSSALSDTAWTQLEKPVAVARANPSVRLVLDAYCDPIGTAPYNIGLAIQRANAVRDALVEMGVPSEQIVFAIYGEDGFRRATYADDRRVSVRESKQPLNAIIAFTFAHDGSAVTWGKPMTMAQLAEAPEPVTISRR
jgi:outer membrane protein OmpA-like peptidoglycan-associated protein